MCIAELLPNGCSAQWSKWRNIQSGVHEFCDDVLQNTRRSTCFPLHGETKNNSTRKIKFVNWEQNENAVTKRRIRSHKMLPPLHFYIERTNKVGNNKMRNFGGEELREISAVEVLQSTARVQNFETVRLQDEKEVQVERMASCMDAIY